jgi:hypothetical protein
MEMPTPTEAHKRLERLAGRWSGEERMTPMPFDPEGGVAHGRVDNRVALDGFAVVQDYEQKRRGTVTYRGHGVYRWDADKDEYVLYWYDSMGGPPTEYRGPFEGDTLTLIGKTVYGFNRAVVDLSEPDRYSFHADASPDGETWETFLEARYTRED